jgi:hypothetical protein
MLLYTKHVACTQLMGHYVCNSDFVNAKLCMSSKWVSI